MVASVPRTAAHQQHHDNVDHSSAEEYYRRTIVLPLLDHLIQQMERFGKTQVLVARLGLVIVTLTDISYEEATSFYSDDFLLVLVAIEVWRWREKWCKEDPAVRPETLQTAG